MQLAAHVSRAITLTEWLDPSIRNEQDPDDRDVELDLYNPQNPNQPPYTDAFIARFRAAQIARSERIDGWVKDKLAALKRAERTNEEFGFVVHGTMADPRWMDLSIDANDRKGPNWCFMGEPKIVNMMPAGLARYCSLRAWLSQWSYRESRADGPKCAADISVPVLVVENSADDACTPSHAARIFAGVAHDDKEFHVVKGATHVLYRATRQDGRSGGAGRRVAAQEETSGLSSMNVAVNAAPARRELPRPDGAISFLEWDGGAGKPPLHFAHANGFNGGTYRRLLGPLANEFHIRAWDARGHGSTTLPADPATHRNWYVYRDDLIAMAEDFVRATGRKVILAGHSLGGAASVISCDGAPGLVRGLVLIDPVMTPPMFRYMVTSVSGSLTARPDRCRVAEVPERRTARSSQAATVAVETAVSAARSPSAPGRANFSKTISKAARASAKTVRPNFSARPHGRPRISAPIATT